MENLEQRIMKMEVLHSILHYPSKEKKISDFVKTTCLVRNLYGLKM
jgi:hypothetical protein